jgi:hypothetical protein
VGAALAVVPISEWGQATDSKITIDDTGAVTPANVRLSKYLYGVQFNPQLRNPPTFEVLFPVAGKFKVTTGSEKAEAPTIAIYLDNKLVINKAAAPKTTYAINVPAGLHSIKVDNLGAGFPLLRIKLTELQWPHMRFMPFVPPMAIWLLAGCTTPNTTGVWCGIKGFQHLLSMAASP